MGNCFPIRSSHERLRQFNRSRQENDALTLGTGNKPLRRDVVWTATEKDQFTMGDLQSKREVFWETAPKYDGREEIWQALKAACDAEDLEFAQVIIDSANISIPTGLLSNGAYDELGNLYKIPEYCFSKPANFLSLSVEESKGDKGTALDESYASGLTMASGHEQTEMEEQGPQVAILLRLSTNKDIRIKLAEKATIEMLKQKLIQMEPGLKQSKFRFLSFGRILTDSMTIAEVKAAVSSLSRGSKELIVQVMITN